ncbi:MAG: hypothetical protein AAF228_12970 [Pseudomonadota bacterium]
MKLREWLEKWNMTSLKIQLPYLEMEWNPQDADKAAAWELYVELLTRITTQPLPDDHGDEETALKSIYAIFGITREVIRKYGPGCIEFTKIAVIVLNQIIRPFTAKWHKLSMSGAFDEDAKRQAFRQDLKALQVELSKYQKMLADISGVEDLTDLQDI